MSAIRLARGFTGRSKVVKFAGCYHGHVDALLAGAGCGVATFGLPDTPGRDRRAARPTRSCCRTTTWRPLEAAFAEHGDEIACVITEAVAGQHGRRPAAARLHRRRCAEHRRARRAAHLRRGDDRLPGARGRLVRHRGPVRGGPPDLFTFGKVMGGGFPAAAFGGRADVMAQLAPAGPGLPGGHAVREPGRHRRRPGARCSCCTPASTSTWTGSRPTIVAGRVARRSREEGVPHVVQHAGQHVQRLLHRPGRSPTTRPPQPQDVAAHRRSSTPCSPAASTCRPPRSRPGSCPAAHDERAVERVAGRAARQPARGRCDDRRTQRERDHVVHLVRHGEVHNPDGVLYGRLPGYHLSDLRPADGRAGRRAPGRPRHPPSWSPRRWSGPRRPRRRSRQRTAWRSAPTTG